jgi:SAM-dependent methyltransferase
VSDARVTSASSPDAKLRVAVAFLRCPATRERLQWSDGALSTADRNHRYPVADGVPVLVDGTLSVFSAEEIVARAFVVSRPTRKRQAIRRLIPAMTLSIGTPKRYEAFLQELLLQAATRRPMVLVVGGGALGVGISTLTESPDIDVVETDVYFGPRVSVVCDGHHLPFADGAFDGVVVQAVLEHVLDPSQVVDEIYRVLRPGGLVYAETPFMQQVHEGPYDFTRWTEIGQRRLFRMFKEIDRGMCAGPSSALLWSLCYFARSLPRKRSSLQLILEKLTVLSFFWLKYLDRLLISHPGASDGASGVYFMGSKADRPVPDSEVLAGYRGSVGRPARRAGP